jgi:hypothetical protein
MSNRTVSCRKCGANLGPATFTESCWGWCSDHDPDLQRHLPADDETDPETFPGNEPRKAGGPRIKIPATRIPR